MKVIKLLSKKPAWLPTGGKLGAFKPMKFCTFCKQKSFDFFFPHYWRGLCCLYIFSLIFSALLLSSSPQA